MPTFTSLGPGEYFVPLDQVDESDAAIEAWHNASVFNVTIEKESSTELLYMSDSDELLGDKKIPSVRPFINNTIDLNLGTEEEPKPIKVYEGLIPKEMKEKKEKKKMMLLHRCLKT